MKNDKEYLQIFKYTKIFKVNFASIIKWYKHNYIYQIPRWRRKKRYEREKYEVLKYCHNHSCREKEKIHREKHCEKLYYHIYIFVKECYWVECNHCKSFTIWSELVHFIVTLLGERLSFDYNWVVDLMGRLAWYMEKLNSLQLGEVYTRVHKEDIHMILEEVILIVTWRGWYSACQRY